MANFEFTNPNQYPVQIKGKDGRTVTFKPNERKVLDQWFKRYAPRYLRLVRAVSKTKPISVKNSNLRKKDAGAVSGRSVPKRNNTTLRNQRIANKLPKSSTANKVRKVLDRQNRRIVGTSNVRNAREASEHMRKVLELVKVPMSNDIGVGILSYNRLPSIKRLLESIRKFTDMTKTMIFVSDESDDKNVKEYLKKQKDIVFVDNSERLGVAGNSNRLLRCLERFRYKIMLNDDVQILQNGWEHLYVNAIVETDIHHFCMRQTGVYGAKPGEGTNRKFKNCTIQTINSKPHGAVIAFDDVAFKKVGYFDTKFGIYGMEHVDWSNRISMSKIQTPGYHDVLGSESMFKIHADKTSVETSERNQSYKEAKLQFRKVEGNTDRIFIGPDEKSKVPEVTYIVPFRGKDRIPALRLVLGNIKAQRFPKIEIIFVEQDFKSVVGLKHLGHTNYHLAKSNTPAQQFTKSHAFNVGVSKASNENLILHDADMLVQNDYTIAVNNNFKKYDACHICRYVIYIDKISTNSLAKMQKFHTSHRAARIVNYFEGGSFGITRKKYWTIGGFNEVFIGYGCEDCEFYERMANLTKFNEDRKINLFHLEHGRTDGWHECHKKNKKLHRAMVSKPMQNRLKVLYDLLRKKGYGKILNGYNIR